MKNYVIHPIPLLTHDFDKTKMTYLLNLGQKITIANYIWYIEGPKENIVVDAGITPERLISRGYKVTPVQTLDEGLKKLGLKASDIDIVIITHTDHDHIALAHKFVRAKFIIQQAELEAARNPHPFFKALRVADFTQLIDGLNFEVVKGDTKIDDNIELLLTPGHTRGGQSVAVKTKQGTVIIAGWCSIQENFDPPPELRAKGLSFIPPGVHIDLLEGWNSIARVKSITDFIIPLHELEYINKAKIG